jgi:3',5'-cyclic AMP phosphodiesterase CpdA
VAALLAALLACGEQVLSPPPADRPAAATGTSSYVTLVGAGDIAGCAPGYRDEATAALISGIPGTVFTTGDNAYPNGSSANYSCYNASWGAFKSRTRPVPGNHEFRTSGAAAYFKYFGHLAGPPGKGYYSYDLGEWHIVALNSETNLAEQRAWLEADLAASSAKCTLAYWHRPLFTSGTVHTGDPRMRPFFRILYEAGADVVLTGHSHQYERFAPQSPNGTLNRRRGIRQFVTGTGGADTPYGFGPPAPNSEARYSGYGVLRLRLYADGYDFAFIPIAGETWTDAGSGVCH